MAGEGNGLFREIDCIRLRVDDIESGLTFYRDKLGHQLVWRTATAAGLKLAETNTEVVLYTEGPDERLDIKVHSADRAAHVFAQAGGAVAVEPFDIAIGRWPSCVTRGATSSFCWMTARVSY